MKIENSGGHEVMPDVGADVTPDVTPDVRLFATRGSVQSLDDYRLLLRKRKGRITYPQLVSAEATPDLAAKPRARQVRQAERGTPWAIKRGCVLGASLAAGAFLSAVMFQLSWFTSLERVVTSLVLALLAGALAGGVAGAILAWRVSRKLDAERNFFIPDTVIEPFGNVSETPAARLARMRANERAKKRRAWFEKFRSGAS